MVRIPTPVTPAAVREKELVLPPLLSDHDGLGEDRRFLDTVDDDGAGVDSYRLHSGKDRRHCIMYPKKDADAFDAAIKSWLATCPGSYMSRSGHEIYRQAFEDFKRVTEFDKVFRAPDFKLGLERLGFRQGEILFNGREIWILVLPSKVKAHQERAHQEKDENLSGPEAMDALLGPYIPTR